MEEKLTLEDAIDIIEDSIDSRYLGAWARIKEELKKNKHEVYLEEESGEVDHGMPDRLYALFKYGGEKGESFEAKRDLPRAHGFVEYVKRSVVVDLLKGKRGLKRASKSHFTWK